jgi:hypothetical protein
MVNAMAMLDYGTILVRDGIIQNRDQMFMEKTDLGCDIPDKLALRGDPDRVAFISGDFFAYAGDMDFMLCFYKYRVLVISNSIYVGDVWIMDDIKPPYEKRLDLFGSGIDVTFECIDHKGRVNEYWNQYEYPTKYKVSWEYKGHKYVAYTGYGIDPKQSVYDMIKTGDNSYDYTETEIAELDRVFKEG